jgi:hypothetical protein
MNSSSQCVPPNVVGGKELVAKRSAVNEDGKLRRTPIHDVLFRPTRPVPQKTATSPRSLAPVGTPLVDQSFRFI